jgi:hypothetical protein
MQDQEVLNLVFKAVTGGLAFFGVRVWGWLSNMQKDIVDLKSENGKLKGKLDLVELESRKEIEGFKELTLQKFDMIQEELREQKETLVKILEKLK